MNRIGDKKGFTLIELLVVIAIIGILTAIISANFGTAKSKARDAKRISDLAQIQLTLEQVFDRCNKYPKSLTVNSVSTIDDNAEVCAGTDASNNSISYNVKYFISKIPTNNGVPYEYTTNTSSNNYVLKVQLENNNPALVDDSDDSSVGSGDNLIRTTGCADTTFFYCVTSK